jgi:adenine-specific DNA-methyltransferase
VDEEGLPFPAEEIEDWELRHARRRGSESSYRHQRKNQFYPIYIDVEGKRVVRAGPPLLPVEKRPSFEKVNGLVPVWPIDKEGNDRVWRFVSSEMQKLIDAKRVKLGKYNTTFSSWTLNIWEKKPESKKLKTVWWKKTHDAGTHGTTLLHNILGRRAVFPFPKSIYAVADALAAVVRTRPNALVLDFFAGSGTTLQSTCMLNKIYGGQRRCILVTNNEVDSKLSARLQKDGIVPGSAE